MNIKVETAKECRRYLNKRGYKGINSYNIRIIDGNQPPTLIGEYGCYKTRGGRYIRHPSSYAKLGWSNMVYVKSTHHIVVGSDWIKDVDIDIEQLRLYKMKGRIVHRDIVKSLLMLY
jgi:hypothetical protein